MKFLIDARALKNLVDRKDNDLGEAILADAEVARQVSLSPSTRALVVNSFEAGYAAALNNVIALIEPCQSPAKENR